MEMMNVICLLIWIFIGIFNIIQAAMGEAPNWIVFFGAVLIAILHYIGEILD